jgi:hypothetical protein
MRKNFGGRVRRPKPRPPASRRSYPAPKRYPTLILRRRKPTNRSSRRRRSSRPTRGFLATAPRRPISSTWRARERRTAPRSPITSRPRSAPCRSSTRTWSASIVASTAASVRRCQNGSNKREPKRASARPRAAGSPTSQKSLSGTCAMLAPKARCAISTCRCTRLAAGACLKTSKRASSRPILRTNISCRTSSGQRRIRSPASPSPRQKLPPATIKCPPSPAPKAGFLLLRATLADRFAEHFRAGEGFSNILQARKLAKDAGFQRGHQEGRGGDRAWGGEDRPRDLLRRRRGPADTVQGAGRSLRQAAAPRHAHLDVGARSGVLDARAAGLRRVPARADITD